MPSTKRGPWACSGLSKATPCLCQSRKRGSLTPNPVGLLLPKVQESEDIAGATWFSGTMKGPVTTEASIRGETKSCLKSEFLLT